MKILQINSVCGRQSTGKIAASIKKELNRNGHTCVIAYGEENSIVDADDYHIGSEKDRYIHGVYTRMLDAHGFASQKATQRLIHFIENFKPDIIHLHNLHGYYLHVESLFRFLKAYKVPVVWTLHDCWPFTGHCTYFSFIGCEKWKEVCNNCPQHMEYPSSILDRSEKNFRLKKELFSEIENLTIVTPSYWLKSLVKQSFLQKHNCVVIPNGIDINVFRKRNSSLREKYRLEGKKIILGVASVWNTRKGLPYFCELAHILDDSYQIVLIGLSKKQIIELPKEILGISNTENQVQLAQWYSTADVFVNPTLEDNYPTTNIESIACDTPVITFDTGGSGESAAQYGTVLREKTAEAIYHHLNDHFYNKIANIESFGQKAFVQKYMKLYEMLYDVRSQNP